MRVEEKDNVVHGMLEEEYERCIDARKALQKKMQQYPKGALNIRKKRYKGKVYLYHYIVSRENGHVKNRHVSSEEVPVLKKKIEERNKNRKEIQAYNKRIVYLEKLLKLPRQKRGRHEKS
jgi:hypothetical protein